jgi:hypothetical protein
MRDYREFRRLAVHLIHPPGEPEPSMATIAQMGSANSCSQKSYAVNHGYAQAREHRAMLRFNTPTSMPLEVLNLALVLLCRRAARKRAEIPPLVRLRIHLARVEPILAGFEFANHGWCSFECLLCWRAKDVPSFVHNPRRKRGAFDAFACASG